MNKPMEHLKQWHNLYQGVLTPNETALYINFFMNANCRFWPEWIELTDSQLSLGTNISVKRIPDVVNALRQKGLIVFERGKGKQPSKYKLCSLDRDISVTANYTQTGVIDGVINGRKTGDKPEINGRKTGDKPEINRRLAQNSPCESKDGKPPNTKTRTTHTQGQGQEKEIQKKKPVDIFASCAESDRVKAALSDFDEMRKKMRAPMTNKAKEILLSKLDELSGGDEFMKVHLLEQSIENGWKSIYPLKQNLSTNISTGNPQNPQKAIDDAIEYFENREEGMA